MGVPLCSLPFPLHALALILLSLTKVPVSPTLRFGTLDCGSFPFGKGGYGILADCSHCGIEATVSFSADPVCSSFSAGACAILEALCWSRQHQQVCHFSFLLLLSDYRCPILHFSFISNSMADLSGTVFSLLFFYQATNGSPDTRFSRGTMRLMSWPYGESYSFPLQSLVVSLRSSLVSILVFFRTGGVLSHLNSSTHRFPRFPPRNSCSLVSLYLVYAATDTAFC